jgi:UDP-N-acetylmuramate dehydrogenase
MQLSRRIRKNVPLKNHTTFRIGGKAEYFFTAKTKEDIIEAVRWAVKRKLPFFILGGGSNVLISDKGFGGLVVKIENEKIKVKNYTSKLKIIEAEAGVKLNDLVNFALKRGLEGIEWASGIPGTVGGAVRGNAAAFGGAIGKAVQEVEALVVEDGNENGELKIRRFSRKECCFAPKESIFKRNKNLVILSCRFKLKKGDKKKLEEKANFCLDYRKKNHPPEPSAGCAFKNCCLKIKDKKLLEKFPELQRFNKKGVIPSAYLIDKAGLRGKKINDAQISPKHANFIVNLKEARSGDVLKLIKIIKKRVKDRFNIELEEEIHYLSP